jgi:hypothetical protein
MRYFLLLLIGYTSVSLASSHHILFPDSWFSKDLKSERLRGNVKSVVSITYTDTGKVASKALSRFNRSGYMTYHKVVNYAAPDSAEEVYEYDEQNNLKVINRYSKSAAQIMTQVFQYSGDGLRVDVVNYGPDKQPTSNSIVRYDKERRPRSLTTYDSFQCETCPVYSYIYDDAGRFAAIQNYYLGKVYEIDTLLRSGNNHYRTGQEIKISPNGMRSLPVTVMAITADTNDNDIEEIHYDTAGVAVQRKLTTYDSYHNILSMDDYLYGNTSKYLWQYEYDAKGNYVICRCAKNSGFERVDETRRITYYK